MTVSRPDLIDNQELALRLMLESLPANRPYEWELLDGDTAPFSPVFPTTWKALSRKGLVKEFSFNRYWFTPAGWIEALKVTGRFTSQDMKEKAGKLSAGLKKRVKARREDCLVSRTELANETGLSESFVYDAIDCHLLRHLFGSIDAYWAPGDQMKNYIEVPSDFGHDP
jgi:hypothetical protein